MRRLAGPPSIFMGPDGCLWSLNEKPCSCDPTKIDGKIQAKITMLALSEPPDGRSKWTLNLLADKLVEMEVVDSISNMTVQRVLKKNELKPWLKTRWCIGKVTADFIWHMEDVLDLYEQPYDQSIQLYVLTRGSATIAIFSSVSPYSS